LQRRNQPEMMDQPQIDERELAVDLRNLAWINRLLGGIAVIRAHLPRQIGPDPQQWTVLDVATGGADIPRWILRRRLPVDLVAVDLHPQMLQLARRWSSGMPIRFVRGDARRLPFRDRSMDVVLCSLMLHHLTELDAARVLRELGRVTRWRLVVNDLRRSRFAYVLIWLITRLSRNPLTRYDSPASVERAFTPAELEALAHEAGLDRQGSVRIYSHRYYRMALVYEPVPTAGRALCITPSTRS
jgi:2-polyprenyl-3-methyl-5-hydroxy-6-metoxy-1,4-benzoquinol methylase